MRPLAWTALTAAALALVLGFVARGTDAEGLNVVAGMLWLTAIVAGIALLPVWRRILPRVEPMPGLFPPVGRGQRWCGACGSVAHGTDACAVCGDRPRRRERTSAQRSRRRQGAAAERPRRRQEAADGRGKREGAAGERPRRREG